MTQEAYGSRPGPRPLGSLLTRLMARSGYGSEQATAALERAWQEAAPEPLRGASRAGLVRRGVLEVHVGHSALVQEFGFHKRAVLERLQTLLPAAGIADVRLRLSADTRPE